LAFEAIAEARERRDAGAAVDEPRAAAGP